MNSFSLFAIGTKLVSQVDVEIPSLHMTVQYDMMHIKGSKATELRSVGSATQKYLDAQLPLIRFLFPGIKVMPSREREWRKLPFFPLKEIKAVAIRKISGKNESDLKQGVRPNSVLLQLKVYFRSKCRNNICQSFQMEIFNF